ncbi:MAG: alpha/beta hydrolase family protein [Thermoanaerobaculia bacterium]
MLGERIDSAGRSGIWSGRFVSASVFAAILVWSAPGLVVGEQRSPVPSTVANDPPQRDPKYPAAMASFQFPSGGARINAILMLAAGAEPHPAVLLLHGFPGYEGILDVGQAIRRAGFNVLAFHYRGAWGSGGSFSFAHCIDDAAAAVAFLREPEVARRYRVNPARIYAVGHSMGGFVAVMLAARDTSIKGIAYISGWDVGNDASSWHGKPAQAVIDDFQDSSLRLRGTSATKLMREAMIHSHEWSLAAVATRLGDRPVLMTVGEFEEDDNPPAINHEPFRRALRAVGANLETQSFPTDHSYSDRRIALASTIVTWLQRITAAGP